jgi:peroxiredoxin
MNKVLILIAGIFLMTCSQTKKEDKSKTTAPGELPALQLTMLTGEKVRVDSLHGKTVLYFFNPDCDHCQREAKDISEHLDAFQDYKIYFIAAPDSGDMEEFASEYDLSNIPNVFFANAEIPEVVRLMGSIGTPTLYIYGNEGQFVKKFENETDVDEVVKFL